MLETERVRQHSVLLNLLGTGRLEGQLPWQSGEDAWVSSGELDSRESEVPTQLHILAPHSLAAWMPRVQEANGQKECVCQATKTEMKFKHPTGLFLRSKE